MKHRLVKKLRAEIKRLKAENKRLAKNAMINVSMHCQPDIDALNQHFRKVKY